MKTSNDWLFIIPHADTFADQKEVMERLLAADPAAVALSESDVVRFYLFADMLRSISRSLQASYMRYFNVRITRLTEPNVRRGIRWLLRLWRQAARREEMLFFLRDVHYANHPSVDAGRDYWTAERLSARVADKRVPLLWVCYIARELGVTDNPQAWLEAQGFTEQADHYRFWVNVSRLTMRQIVYPEQSAAAMPVGEVAAAAMATDEDLTELKVKEQKTTALRHNVRKLERDRKLLKEKNRRVEQEIKSDLSQARGEVAAAQRGLKEFRAAHRAALAELERRFEREKAAIEKQMAEARAAFARTLRQQQVVPVLAERYIQVLGAKGDLSAVRAQVESLGARFVMPGASSKADTTIDGGGGHAALERQLRSLALGDLHIKCDGNWRRKMGRHGISNAAFEVLRNGRSIYQDGRPVCCGPLTSPIMSEYAAIIMALSWVLVARPAAGSRVLVWSDCKFLVDHINGRWRLAPERGCAMLDHLLVRLLRRTERLGYRVAITWVPRTNVHDMDRLCAATYYATTWYHRWKKGDKVPTLPLERFLRTV